MADRVRVSDLDFVYISFREPNKEQNWADLKNKVPWAKRVDGVVGFDSAHKAAAELAETDFFISVDGDNIIDERFLLETLDWTKTNKKAVHQLEGQEQHQRTGVWQWWFGWVGQGNLSGHEDTRERRQRKRTRWTSVGECHTRTYTTAIQQP
jgi:YD repeat-containing protein